MSGERHIDRGLLALGVGVALCLTAALVATSQGWLGVHTLSALAADRGTGTARTAALYVGFVVVAELLWLPRSWGLVASGLLFGPWLGIALSATADLTTAAFAYAVARRAGSGGTRAWLARRPRAAALVESLASRGGFLTVCALRVLPVHWTATSYAAGLAAIPPGAYFGGTALGLLPAAVVFNLAGDALQRHAYASLVVAAALALLLAFAGRTVGRRWLAARGPSGDDEIWRSE